MNEEQRYAAVAEQIKDLFDAATTERNPLSNLLRALLCAEMYERNESAHHQVLQARNSLIQTDAAHRASEKGECNDTNI